MTAPKDPQPPPDALVRAVLSPEAEAALRRTLGARVREARLELGITQHQLALAFGIGQSGVAEMEKGRACAQPYVIQALASATGRSVGWFFGEPDRR